MLLSTAMGGGWLAVVATGAVSADAERNPYGCLDQNVAA